MRILIAGTFPFPEGGGAPARATHMQAKGLAELGHEVTVAICWGTLPPGQTYYDGFRVISFDDQWNNTQGSNRGSWHWTKAQINLLIYLLVAVIQGRFDYILFYGSAPIFVPISIVGALLKRFTCLIQGDLIEMNKGIPGYCVTGERVLARRVKCIIVIGSSVLVDHYKRIAPTVPSILTWPPTDVNFYKNGNPSVPTAKYNFYGKKVIVYVGAINSLEGIDSLLAAMKEIVAKKSNALLVLAGRITEVDPIYGKPIDYMAMIANLGLSKHVFFTGFLSMNEVADLLCSADVLVNPKIDHILNRVAAPIKIGEYLSSGRPVVSTRVCELENWLRDREEVLFCDPGNAKQLASCIEELIDNVTLAEHIAQGAYLVAKRKCHYTTWASEVSQKLEAIRLGRAEIV
jgi:glycosyltransferase involved in cell wall biosynthesis